MRIWIVPPLLLAFAFSKGCIPEEPQSDYDDDAAEPGTGSLIIPTSPHDAPSPGSGGTTTSGGAGGLGGVGGAL